MLIPRYGLPYSSDKSESHVSLTHIMLKAVTSGLETRVKKIQKKKIMEF